MAGARGIQKELTEEEKANLAAVPQKGKPAPAKGKAEDKPPTQDELAAIEAQRQAKEELERVKQA